MILYINKEAAEILGVKGVNRSVLREVLVSNDFREPKDLEQLYAKSVSQDFGISSELRLECATLVKKIKGEYSKGIVDHERDVKMKSETDAENRGRTMKAMNAMLIDVKKLSDKYAGLVGADNHHLSLTVPGANSYEQKVLGILVTLAQNSKKG